MNTKPLPLDVSRKSADAQEEEARLRFGEMCTDFVYGVPDNEEEQRWTPTRNELRQAAADWALHMERVEAQSGQMYFADRFAVKRPAPSDPPSDCAEQFKEEEAQQFDIIIRSAAVLLLTPWSAHSEFVRREVTFWFRRALLVEHADRPDCRNCGGDGYTTDDSKCPACFGTGREHA